MSGLARVITFYSVGYSLRNLVEELAELVISCLSCCALMLNCLRGHNFRKFK